MSYTILNQIQNPKDLKKLTIGELEELARELRRFIIEVVATKEGHLGASLGMVELSIALHYVFDTPSDQLVWDVGHQAYGHKLLTGRFKDFYSNRQKGGISGFPKRDESVYDAFGVGHSSTSISAILGMAIASKLQGNTKKQHIAVIGDASIAAGMAFEGLNHAGVSDTNMLVILNDNAIGIDPSVGALKDYLASVKQGKNPRVNNMIKSLHFKYDGPLDGHNLQDLIKKLEQLKKRKGPKFLHLITTKGKGLKQAEENQVKYHAPGKFNSQTGELLKEKTEQFPAKYQDVFGHTLVELAKANPNIVGITPAMPTGSSMGFLMDAFPERAFDVGIAEQHAVTLAAGMATQGLLPFCAIYSTFLQRAYDQIIHDVALQKLPVVFCIDRAGLVGEDGATHQGVFDLAYLSCIPNLIIAAPLNEVELRNLLYTAQLETELPWAIRYPRGRGVLREDWRQSFSKISIGNVRELQKGNKFVILSTGTIGNHVISAFNQVQNSAWGHCHFTFVKPLNEVELHRICQQYERIVTIEDASVSGGFGSLISQFVSKNYSCVSVESLGVHDQFVEHATVQQQYEECGIDIESIIRIIKE
ncbi:MULTISPECIES: 1-deoxy-D-xylulose-5-phosphate synthase [Myroides]|uniref:1-deoxy-D-xylulose-5-phosphate synthase n=1 Tax=Myroides albus TaxID=2562892 RepID=A0A6I3LFD2_9FLAO|nr:MULTISPECIES: 1-deoxy-D-xylulose-5-phosphate synthase [Myroides]MTG96873.1 1-deoxy-D-xylulose-5-phosphate synthase [Myroides albus]MVX36503.1 1-deoxy-D-xylulose-5-phosphate synthase [Myroides sp. LoEW2-1]UVD78377.1 1-deoxy-D-xylulose-5-phosphate synthase [Myroides albus]